MSYLQHCFSGGKTGKFAFSVLSPLVVIAAFTSLPCHGQDAPAPLYAQPVQWVVGPAQANLGDIAEIKVPAGFKFTDAQGAAGILSRAQKNVLGVLTPEAGGWLVVFEYSDIGHVKDPDKQVLEAESILKTVRAQVERQVDNSLRQGKAPITGLAWAMQPIYNAESHVLEWAIAADSGPGSAANINHTVRMLGRHGVLDAIAVFPGSSGLAAIPLNDLVKTIAFKSGESYADYQEGDKVCPLGLAQLIASDTAANPTGNAPSRSVASSPMFWAGLLGAGTGVAIVWVLLSNKSRRHKTRLATSRSVESASHATVAGSTGNGSNHPEPTLKTKPVNNNGNGNRRGSRRRKSVDYTRYFMDLRSSVSDHSVYLETDVPNGYQIEPVSADVQAVPATNGAPHAEKAAHANAEMIAHQRNLIEEQQRLIHEQTKLIEEKSRLVAEKNQLLARQAELLDERLLPS